MDSLKNYQLWDKVQVIDEQEFLEFYHSLLDRRELREIFRANSPQFRGLTMTAEEMRAFMAKEQGQEVKQLNGNVYSVLTNVISNNLFAGEPR